MSHISLPLAWIGMSLIAFRETFLYRNAWLPAEARDPKHIGFPPKKFEVRVNEPPFFLAPVHSGVRGLLAASVGAFPYSISDFFDAASQPHDPPHSIAL